MLNKDFMQNGCGTCLPAGRSGNTFLLHLNKKDLPAGRLERIARTKVELYFLLTAPNQISYMAFHNDTGKTGEDLAAIWFEEKDYKILHKNWRHQNLEVDIIATQNNMLHFIEVKAVTTLKFGNPEDKVGEKKIRNLINASEEYLFQNPQWQRIQFDVLSITMIKNSAVEYFLIEDVYL